jgi:hypothetical protein
MQLRYEQRRTWEVNDIWCESTSGKSSDCRVWKSLALGVIPGDDTEVRGGIHMNRGRVGEERGGKEMDGCPLTLPPLQSAASRHAKTTRRLPGLL